MWTLPQYRVTSPALKIKEIFKRAFKPQIKDGDRLIDFGCGSGAITPFFLNLGLSVDLIDIANNCLNKEIEALCHITATRFVQASLWNLPDELAPSEWIFCTDVLEHLPESKVALALSEMAKRTLKGGLLQIYLEDEPFGALIEESLHLSVKPHEFWVDLIGKYWPIHAVSPKKGSLKRLLAIVGRGYDVNHT